MEEIVRNLIERMRAEFRCTDPNVFDCEYDCEECTYYGLPITEFNYIINEYERKLYEV